jgi:hypothetical protein
VHADAPGADAAPPADGSASLAVAPGVLVRVKVGLKGLSGLPHKCCGCVGVVEGVQGQQVFVRVGPRRIDLHILAPADLLAHTSDPVVGQQVRVVQAGMMAYRQQYRWQTGTVAACKDDGWLINFPPAKPGGDERSAVFGVEELESLS